MGATVVNALTASYWASNKPGGYKGQDLDKALKAYEPLAGKGITIPGNLIPSAPKATMGDIDACIKSLQSAITELQKGQTYLKQIVGALQAVQSAAAKAAGELTKLSTAKDADKSAMERAAATAKSIGSMAGSVLKQYQ